MPIASVWIEDGCICCQACVGACPAVFIIPEGVAEVLGEARMDQLTSANRVERAGLRVEVAEEHDDAIREAIAGCPVDIIRFAA